MDSSTQEAILVNGKRNKAEGLDVLVSSALKDKYRLEELIGYLADERPNVAARAAWALRRVVEQSVRTVQIFKPDILSVLTRDLIWEVRAELCHVLPMLEFAPNELNNVRKFYRDGLSSESRIVVAWSLNGLYELCHNSARWKVQLEKDVSEALKSPHAAVSARARAIQKQLAKKRH